MAWIMAHLDLILILVGYFILIPAAGTMPELPESAGFFARWAHDYLHAVVGNYERLLSSRKMGKATDGKSNIQLRSE